MRGRRPRRIGRVSKCGTTVVGHASVLLIEGDRASLEVYFSGRLGRGAPRRRHQQRVGGGHGGCGEGEPGPARGPAGGAAAERTQARGLRAVPAVQHAPPAAPAEGAQVLQRAPFPPLPPPTVRGLRGRSCWSRLILPPRPSTSTRPPARPPPRHPAAPIPRKIALPRCWSGFQGAPPTPCPPPSPRTPPRAPHRPPAAGVQGQRPLPAGRGGARGGAAGATPASQRPRADIFAGVTG